MGDDNVRREALLRPSGAKREDLLEFVRDKDLEEILTIPDLRAEGVDELVTVLWRRWLLPRPKNLKELLLLLASSSYAREVLENRSHLWAGPELDAIAACWAKVEDQVRSGLLDDRALLGFGPVAKVNAKFCPPARLFTDFLARLMYRPGLVFAAEVLAVSQALDVPSLNDEVASILKDMDGRSKEIVRRRCVPYPPPTLKQLGERYGVTGERIRQIERRELRRLRKVRDTRPLPRIRTTVELARQLHHRNLHPLYEALRTRELTTSESVANDSLVLWRAMYPENAGRRWKPRRA